MLLPANGDGLSKGTAFGFWYAQPKGTVNLLNLLNLHLPSTLLGVPVRTGEREGAADSRYRLLLGTRHNTCSVTKTIPGIPMNHAIFVCLPVSAGSLVFYER